MYIVWLVSLLPFLWPSQYCWGAIAELSKFRDKTSVGGDTVVDVSFPADHLSTLRSPASEQVTTYLTSSSTLRAFVKKVWKRETASGQPHIDGTHQFHDGYRRGSIAATVR